MQLLQFLAFSVSISFLPSFQAIQANFIEKWSQWNYHGKTIVKLPLAEWGSAGVPFLFIYFHAFAASLTFPSDNIISLQDSQATFFLSLAFPSALTLGT